MTFGARFWNDSGYVSIDENTPCFGYLGKYLIPNLSIGSYSATIQVNCVGFPLVFFDVPYASGPGGGRSRNTKDGVEPYLDRFGMQLSKISAGSAPNTWLVEMRWVAMNAGLSGLYIRVFGAVHLNFPNGTGDAYGARFWNSAGQVIFDTGSRPLRLVGNSFSAELVLDWHVPSPDQYENNDKFDNSIWMPSDMAGKSICANTRGAYFHLFNNGMYTDWDTGVAVYQYLKMQFDTYYWASGSTLYARKICTDFTSEEFYGAPPVIVTANSNTVYTRVCAIDNSLYP